MGSNTFKVNSIVQKMDKFNTKCQYYGYYFIV